MVLFDEDVRLILKAIRESDEVGLSNPYRDLLPNARRRHKGVRSRACFRSDVLEKREYRYGLRELGGSM